MLRWFKRWPIPAWRTLLANKRRVSSLVCDLVGSLSADFVQRFVAVLRAHDNLTDITPIRIMREVNNDAARDKLWEFLRDARAIDSALSSASLTVGLECALEATERDAEKQKIDVVWTGPGTESALRRTAPVLLEMLRSAEKEIVVISFAAFRIADALEVLEEKARAGVAMHFILESKDDSDGRLHTDAAAAFAALTMYRNVKFYTWPLGKRPWGSLLHAKAIIVDGKTALTTSANLTENAISSNIELGLLLNGGDAPARIHEHIKALIAAGEFAAQDEGR